MRCVSCDCQMRNPMVKTVGGKVYIENMCSACIEKYVKGVDNLSDHWYAHGDASEGLTMPKKVSD